MHFNNLTITFAEHFINYHQFSNPRIFIKFFFFENYPAET